LQRLDIRENLQEKGLMERRKARIKMLILNVLKDAGKPMGSAHIMDELRYAGLSMSERAIRMYLNKLDDDGLTFRLGRKGRLITEAGLREVESSKIIERVGFLSARIDQITYRMSFDLREKSGTVIVNISIVKPEQVKENLDLIYRVYEHGFAMGEMIALFGAGENIGAVTIPDGMVGIGTVCSITLNGVLLKAGIPMTSRFGGLLEVRDFKPSRFAEIIMYDGTSLDPLEIFIKSGMTDNSGAISTGKGRIGAGFREFPSDCLEKAYEVDADLKKTGLGGFKLIGRPSQSLLEIPVGEGRIGSVVIGGLNPIAVLEENGIRIHSKALAGIVDYDRLFHYTALGTYLKQHLLIK
jgi:HTH-type transcriptional regulator, global nitrogen regulator NrpRI